MKKNFGQKNWKFSLVICCWCTQKISSVIKGFLYFLYTPLFWKKGYTFDVFWALLLSCGWRTCWSASSKSWPSQCPPSCSGTPGVRWKSNEDLQADLQLRMTCSCRLAWCLYIVLCLSFLDFFDKNTFGHISYVFHLFFKFFLQISMDMRFFKKLVFMEEIIITTATTADYLVL